MLVDPQVGSNGSLVFSLIYDATELEYLGLESGARTSEFYTFANPDRDGVVHGVALGWKAAADASGEVLVLRFRTKRASFTLALGFSRLQVNDRAAQMTPEQLRIYDGGGRLVYAAPQEQRGPGLHAYRWEGIDHDGRPVASGVYFVRIDAGPWSETRKLSLLK